MAKSKNKSKKKRVKKAVQPVAEPQKRDTLKLLRNGAIAAVLLGGVGTFATRKVMADLAEQDLSQIGGGMPTVVQIHDPQCPLCQALQKEVRAALEHFEDGTIQYLVANIRTTEGADLARRLGVPHVTIVLFDAQGEVQDILQGPRSEDAIKAEFETTFGVAACCA